MEKNFFGKRKTGRRYLTWMMSGCLLLLLAIAVWPKEQKQVPSAMPNETDVATPQPLVLSPAPEGYTPTFGGDTQSNDKTVTASAQAQSADKTADESAKEVAVAISTPLLWPASGSWDRGFGMDYDPTCKDYRFHQGADMKLAEGTNILCPLSGKVVLVVEDDFYGMTVVIQHKNNLKTVYAGLQPVVMEDDELKAGDVLGQISDPPPIEEAQGTHLHFEIWEGDTVVDPAEYMQ